MKKRDVLSMDNIELSGLIAGLGEKSFRAGQIFSWLHQKGAGSFAEMTNLPKSLISELSEGANIYRAKIVKKLQSNLDGTAKYIMELTGGHLIESVYMSYKHGATVCISSQAGCRMGCAFCASTLNGLARNLSAGEMLSQIYEISRDKGERISNVVVMGCGEPLDNFDNLIRFLELANDPNGMNLSHRHITVSTCGLVDKIRLLADMRLQITLALSLHAPNDEIRKKLMPVAKRYGVDETINACKNYAKDTGRRVSYEYALISGVNDSPENARELGAKIRHSLCHVNLIPVNEIAERSYKKSREEIVASFAGILEGMGISVTLRRELGRDISAACGQLRNSLTKRD